jgi:hypothetical protein
MNSDSHDSDGLFLVALDSKYVYIQRTVFVELFKNSHVYYLKDYQKALEDNRIKFNTLRELSRRAGIPYSLFFAPIDKVEDNIDRNNSILFEGVQNVPMAIASRGDVSITDVNLIIKDIQKRQRFMSKRTAKVNNNVMIGLPPIHDVADGAFMILELLGLDMNKFRNYTTKEKAYEYLVSVLENNNIIISRSRIGAMPQNIRRELAFSGFTVRHKKYPAIFLYSKDEDMVNDPVGRRIFTIFLLLSCMANNRYAVVSYNQNVEGPIENIEYQVAEEILMPEEAVSGVRVESVEELKDLSNTFKVTPSMALMRLKRLGCIGKVKFDEMYEELKLERIEASKKVAKKGFKYNVPDTTKIITYNGRLFTSKVIDLLRTGKISMVEASRLLVFRKKGKTVIQDIMEKV